MFRTGSLSIKRGISTILAWSGWILTTLTDANRNSVTNTYWVYAVLRYS